MKNKEYKARGFQGYADDQTKITLTQIKKVGQEFLETDLRPICKKK